MQDLSQTSPLHQTVWRALSLPEGSGRARGHVWLCRSHCWGWCPCSGLSPPARRPSSHMPETWEETLLGVRPASQGGLANLTKFLWQICQAAGPKAAKLLVALTEMDTPVPRHTFLPTAPCWSVLWSHHHLSWWGATQQGLEILFLLDASPTSALLCSLSAAISTAVASCEKPYLFYFFRLLFMACSLLCSHSKVQLGSRGGHRLSLSLLGRTGGSWERWGLSLSWGNILEGDGREGGAV